MSDNIQNSHTVSRRAFLAAIPAAVAVSPFAASAIEPVPADNPKLAIDGGKPLRSTYLDDLGFPGARMYGEEEKDDILKAYATKTIFRFYGPGKPVMVESFEKEFSALMGVRYTLGITSGTAALHAALVALGVGPGDEVILPAWAWHSCYTTIVLTGALPVFAEVDESLCIDPADVEAKVTPQTKVVMVVHPEGTPVDMDGIMSVARKHGVKVLEDVAQSCGGQYKGRRLGTIGDIGIYSFQIHKLISAGEGGAVVTNDPQLYERAIRLHDLGLVREVHEKVLGIPNPEIILPAFPGTNYRMNELTGAVMRAQLQKLDGLIAKLRHNARVVREGLQREVPGLKLRRSNDLNGDIGWTIGVFLPDKKARDRFSDAVEAENVSIGSPSSAEVLPPLPYVAQKAVPHPSWPTFNSPRGREIRYGAECCPRSIDLFSRSVRLTIGSRWTESDLKDVVGAMRKVYQSMVS
jgi:8-amino-3,8-dideoxy-alpha-D-manno-octulosonate transaminase